MNTPMKKFLALLLAMAMALSLCGFAAAENTVPVVISNLYLNGEKVTFAKDCVILEKKAVSDSGDEIVVRVAVVGFALDYSTSIMNRKFSGAGFTLSEDFDALERLAAELEKSGTLHKAAPGQHTEAFLAVKRLFAKLSHSLYVAHLDRSIEVHLRHVRCMDGFGLAREVLKYRYMFVYIVFHKQNIKNRL